MVWSRNERIQKELCRTFHHRISAREKVFITGEFVVIPQMRAKPRAARGPEPPEWSINGRGLSPQIRVVMTNPATRAVLNTRSACAILHQLRHHPQQWLVTLGKVRGLGWPVVHLRVDVDRVLAFPRRRHQVVPDALQVRGLRAWTRR